MNLFSTDVQILKAGLRRRKWLYSFTVILALWILGDWYMNRPTQYQLSFTFDSLKEDIHHRDSLATRGWRFVWAQLPVMVQHQIPTMAPSVPASEIRLMACARFPHFGEKALPFIIPKLQDSDLSMVQEAMIGILDIGTSNDETFEALCKVAKNKQLTVGVRRVAMLTVLVLHGDEDRSISFLRELDDPTDYDALDSVPLLGNGKVGNRVIRPIVSYAPGEMRVLSVLNGKWSNHHYVRLLSEDKKTSKLLVIYLLQSHWKMDDTLKTTIQKLMLDEDSTVSEQATLLIQQHFPLGLRGGGYGYY